MIVELTDAWQQIVLGPATVTVSVIDGPVQYADSAEAPTINTVIQDVVISDPTLEVVFGCWMRCPLAGVTAAVDVETDGYPVSAAYVYIAYASDDTGTGFTLTFNPALDYIAILPSDTPIAAPVVGDFAGLWKNYKGAAGTPGAPGADGADGAVWYAGAADPAGGTGQNGDFYLQTGTGATGVLGDVWTKSAGSWAITGNIRGAPGAGAVSSVNGQTGDVVLEADDIDTTAAGTFAGDPVEFVLDDHDARIVDLEGQIVSLTGTDIANTPAGGIAAITVQGAINELDTEKAAVTAVREKLTADRTYYVRTDGSDSNNGLTNNAGGAFLTIQKAVDVISGTLDIGTQIVTIQVGAGTYTAATTLKQCVGAGEVIIVGDEVTPANVLISVTGATPFRVLSLMTTLYRLRGMKLTATGAANLIVGDGPSKVVFRNLDFGSCAAAQIIAQLGAVIDAEGGYTISGGAPQHVRSVAGVFRIPDTPTITLTGTPAFSSAFASSERTGVIICLGATFSGSATGPRYSATLNGVIAVGGAGATYFPGNAAGSVATGGQYA